MNGVIEVDDFGLDILVKGDQPSEHSLVSRGQSFPDLSTKIENRLPPFGEPGDELVNHLAGGRD